MIRDVKYLSFGSSKGGVGRTMTLANCARLYSQGVTSAGIVQSDVVLIDLDIYAPGLQFYNYFDDRKINIKFYNSNEAYTKREDLHLALQKKDIGLIHLLTNIVNNDSYKDELSHFSHRLEEANEEETQPLIEEFSNALINDFLVHEIDPTNHLIEITSNQNSIFLLPAGSPENANFSKKVLEFDWKSFITGSYGTFLLNCIIVKAIRSIHSRGIGQKPVRVLIDQQAGISLPGLINKSLSHAQILVSGFNEQNKSGLKGQIETHIENFPNEKPWIVLNQYNCRDLAFNYDFDTATDFVSPHQRFLKCDTSQRINYINSITDESFSGKISRDNIFVTEFINEAIQKEYFYDSDKISLAEITRLLVSIEKSFQDEVKKIRPVERQTKNIVFIGEKIKFKSPKGANFQGPLAGIRELLSKYFGKKCKIVAIAASHEDILSLIENGSIRCTLRRSFKAEQAISFSRIAQYDETFELIRDDNGENIDIAEFDFISYPFYAKENESLNRYIRKFEQSKFRLDEAVEDSLKHSNIDYFKNSILGWEDYCVESGKITGVPLFVNFQLLTYKTGYFTDNQAAFLKKYKREFRRNFRGFLEPSDILNFTKLTKLDEKDDYNNLITCDSSSQIPLWYELQTNLYIFNHDLNTEKVFSDKRSYLNFLKQESTIEALFSYLKVRSQADKRYTRNNDNSTVWEVIVNEFYKSDRKNNCVFIWPDTIPQDERSSSKIVYQVPPSFHIFEECWLLSAIKRNNDPNESEKLDFLNYYLTPEAQRIYLEYGGLPIHKGILSSLDIWRQYPFIPHLWAVFYDKKYDRIRTPRKPFQGQYIIAKEISNMIGELEKELKLEEMPTKQFVVDKIRHHIDKIA